MMSVNNKNLCDRKQQQQKKVLRQGPRFALN